MTNVLVTGADGQLGSCIKDLEPHNLNIIYTDRSELDICNLKQVETFFQDNTPIDYCVNCAAYTAVDDAETNTEKAYNINQIGARNLALACTIHKSILIHLSTDFVFDGKKTIPYKETDLTSPLSVYGDSKLMGENEIIRILNKHFIIRTSWLYCEHGHNFLKTMLQIATNKGQINVVKDQIGTPTYAKDLAKVILEIINNDSLKYGIYHYSNLGEASWFDFAKAIFKLSKTKIKVYPSETKDYPTPAKRPPYSVLDKSKIQQMLKIQIPNWEDSLKIAISNLK